PEAYNSEQLENIRCKLLQFNVLSWGIDGAPDRIRIVWQIFDLTSEQKALLDKVFRRYLNEISDIF
ncbi:hypothetical protein ACFL27_21055, partial [candidate division CSSED10-310 bacterium]